jgi:hypothetical protein
MHLKRNKNCSLRINENQKYNGTTKSSLCEIMTSPIDFTVTLDSDTAVCIRDFLVGVCKSLAESVSVWKIDAPRNFRPLRKCFRSNSRGCPTNKKLLMQLLNLVTTNLRLKIRISNMAYHHLISRWSLRRWFNLSRNVVYKLFLHEKLINILRI